MDSPAKMPMVQFKNPRAAGNNAMADKQHGVQIPECSDTNTESFNKATASTKLTTSASSGHTEQDCSDAPTPQLPWLICRLQQIQSLRSKKTDTQPNM
ncbi:MAG: hypothetical protein CMM01_05095 [Rhodopirellula sp.]|nr:hypothetical protein [Rhodopirellula sp.]